MSIFDDAYKLLKEEPLDVTLEAGVDGKKVTAHRIVLCAAAGYFRGLFASKFKERDKSEIRIKDITGEILDKVIECCYTGRIDINDDNIESLLGAASYFQFPRLEKKCTDFLLKDRNISTDNCVGVWILANRYGFKEIKKKASSVLFENFWNVSNCAEFYQLHKTELKEVLEKDEIVVKSEKDVFNALVGWVKFNSEERRRDFPDLLEMIRLDQPKDSFVDKEVQAICDEFKCADTYLKLKKLRSSHLEAKIQSRERLPLLSDFIVLTAGEEHIRILQYSHTLDEWTILHQMPYKRLHYAAVIVDMKLYIMGGDVPYDKETTAGSDKMDSLCIDLITFESRKLKTMPTPRTGLSVVADGDFIYAAGGHDYGALDDFDYAPSNTVERYDIKSDEWSEVAPMLHRRRSAAIANLSGTIYVIGGQNYSTLLNSVEKYDPIKNEWSLVAPMINERSHALAGVSNGYLYVCHGPYDRSMERYDPHVDEWSLLNFQISFPDDFIFSVGRGWIFWGCENKNFRKQNLLTAEVVELTPLLDILSPYILFVWADPSARLASLQII